MRPVPASIQRPPYADSGRLPGVERRPQVHNAQVCCLSCACELEECLMPAELLYTSS
jgi:hypothetical protein